jgi:inorganic pyrophosphatase
VEIEHFFSIYKEPEGKAVEVAGFADRDAALEAIADARDRFAAQ